MISLRRAQIVAGWADITERVASACERAGRTDEVTVIAVTKGFSLADAQYVIDAGARHIGESRDQEASAKIAGLERNPGVRVHFVGQVQRNKAASIAKYAHVIHSVDRAPLVAALGKAATAADRTLECFIEIALDGTGQRGGCPPDQTLALAEQIVAQPALSLKGIMGVAPRGEPPSSAFHQLRRISEGLQSEHPQADSISAGMSGDFEQAIAEGATHLRVGTAILGSRPPLR